MDNISPIWMMIEGRFPGVSNVQTQIDTHGDIFPQHQNWKIHTYHNLQAYSKPYQFWNMCVNYIIKIRDS